MKEYTEALCKEIEAYKDIEIETVFIGGGTPTYLSIEALELLKNTMKKLRYSKSLEFTVEGNPGTFTEEKLKLFKEMGMNRLSIGLQSFDDNLLKSIGRIHSAEDFKESYYMARKMGVENINMDLIFGLPNQSLEKWIETLREAMTLNPDHISCYSLIVEENTAFYNLYEKNLLNLPNEDTERDMYSITKNVLKEHGYEQYEISNYCKKGKECRHNLVYWNLENYIGCGVAAHSYYNGERFSNSDNIKEYINMINEKNSPIISKSKNTLQDDMEEFMFLGLRKIKGISIEEFKQRFKVDIYDVYKEVIEKYKDLNLLQDSEGYVKLTTKGIEVSNVVMADFIIDRE